MTVDQVIAERLAALRQQQRLSLAQLGEKAGVSKAMISKIERLESSPTAAILGRLAAGLGVSLTDLLEEERSPRSSILRRQVDQPTWQDSQTGYIRRQVAERRASGSSELIEIELPAATRVDYPQWHSSPYHQRVWVLQGRLEVRYGDDSYSMEAGDVLEFAVDLPVSYIADHTLGCRYLLNILYDQA